MWVSAVGVGAWVRVGGKWRLGLGFYFFWNLQLEATWGLDLELQLQFKSPGPSPPITHSSSTNPKVEDPRRVTPPNTHLGWHWEAAPR